VFTVHQLPSADLVSVDSTAVVALEPALAPASATCQIVVTMTTTH